MSIEAMKQALEALESFREISDFTPAQAVHAITTLRTAIAEAEKQEPVGRVVSANCEYATVQWLRQTSEVGGGDPKNSRSWPIAGDAVYTTPQPQREWVGLTDEEIWSNGSRLSLSERGIREFARAIEAKLKEKNGG
ncbi:MAG: hypothetical protein EBR82_54995 [Caulobacteraceae bacterium]|jgi:hypothetical protein|nr:hypothetical protein [Caulobacteraceae bacterium]